MTKKPQGQLKIDRSHPLAIGLAFFGILNEHSCTDIVTGERQANSLDFKRINGEGFSIFDTNTGFSFSREIVVPLTMITSVNRDSSNNTNHTRALTVSDDTSTSKRCSIGLEESGNFLRGNNNDGLTNTVFELSMDVGDRIYFATVIERDSSRTLYVDGTSRTASSSSSLSFSGLNTVTVGAVKYSGGQEGFLENHGVSFSIVYSGRELTDHEIDSLHKDPYQFLIPAVNIQDAVHAALFGAGGVNPIAVDDSYDVTTNIIYSGDVTTNDTYSCT